MGTPEFAVPSLEILLQASCDIAAVVTAPDKPRGRGQEMSPTPVKRAALAHNLPLLQPERLDDPGFVHALKDLHPDLAVVVAFRILPNQVFAVPRLGTFNLHASLLPRYRGAAPINWAIINGETETGVTTFFLEESVDTGMMILQERVEILPEDDAGALHDRLAPVGAKAVLDTVRLIEQGKAHPRPQENARASRAPKIFREQCRIGWDQPAERIHNLIRGLSPAPGAFTMLGGKVLKIFKTRVLDAPAQGPPATLRPGAGTLEVDAADKRIALLEVQQEGRKRMTTEEFLRGFAVPAGELFGS